ncbi:patatin-like phospholipase domain-containing protein 1 isoform X1 [Oxyura jamaicensis]|uniref:patatin-like phospholipase domain-containing protein 1 isoform X1 n=1 Tax=Oxyura jamaicensis TaxID=8884 RepID=UPI0015A688B7|nr:patatin-like phospholipase domain-containing protein 1 isoform X1 [Oxyura jamaicensis]
MPFFQVEIHLRKYITNKCFVLALDELQKQFISGDIYSFKGLLSTRGKILHILKDALNKFLPVNAHQLVSGKLHVILTRVRDWRSVTVSEFATKEDLIQALLCSCFVPLCFGFLPPLYHGVRYVDGELGMWKANFTSQTMITVSAFAGEYDICPKDCPAAFFNFQISDCILQISKKNIYRFLCIFLCPTKQVCNQFYDDGYRDTVTFLKNLSLFGINYLAEDLKLPLDKELCQKGEGTLHRKLEARILHSRATDTEDITKENILGIQAAHEVEEEDPQHPLQPPERLRELKTSGKGEIPLSGY